MNKRTCFALSFFIVVFLVCASYGATTATVRAAESGENLITNPSVEIAGAQASKPKSWATDKWGNLKATFSYPNNGKDSSRSLKVQVSNYRSGDAKWYFAPVQVTPNTNYTYTEYYKSNVRTRIVAMSLDASGTPTYIDVATKVNASANNWTQFTGTIRTLPTTVSLTVFHIVERNGWLQIDDSYLSLVAAAVPIVPNASLEIESPDPLLPLSWNPSGWGTNTPTYSYLTGGAKDGTRSVKVEITNYVDGDASWGFDPQALTPGNDYQFVVWYKTNTIPHVVARYERADGSEYFFGMPDPEPAGTGWQVYRGQFSVPADAVRTSAYMFISNDGWLQTDKYSIRPYVFAGFNQGLVSIVFDDGYEQDSTTAFPVIEQYGWKATLCAATEFVEGYPSQIAMIQQIAANGHEICSHTVTHPDLTTLPTADVDYELTHAKAFLQSITGQAVENFASPYGAYNASVNTEIAQYQYSHRTTDEGYNSRDTFNKYRLKVQNMQLTTTLADFQMWVNKAKADKTWLILVYHVVDTAPTEQFDTHKADFDAQMQWLSTSGITVKKWNEALLELEPQL